MSIIFSCALVRESSVALIVLRRPFSGLDCASRPIQPSSLGGLIAKSVSMNSIGNSFEIALEASVEIPLVIQPEISAEITFETDNGCTTELPGKFKLSKCGVGVVSSPKSTTSSSALGLVDGRGRHGRRLSSGSASAGSAILTRFRGGVFLALTTRGNPGSSGRASKLPPLSSWGPSAKSKRTPYSSHAKPSESYRRPSSTS